MSLKSKKLLVDERTNIRTFETGFIRSTRRSRTKKSSGGRYRRTEGRPIGSDNHSEGKEISCPPVIRALVPRWDWAARSSAIAEKPRDALCQLKSCQLLPQVKLSLFDTFYSWSAVTTTPSGTISKIPPYLQCTWLPDFNLPYPYLAPPLRVTPLEFSRYLASEK